MTSSSLVSTVHNLWIIKKLHLKGNRYHYFIFTLWNRLDSVELSEFWTISFNISAKLNELGFWPVIGHFEPVETWWLNDNIKLVILPNFCQVGKRCFTSSIIIEFFCVVIYLTWKDFRFRNGTKSDFFLWKTSEISSIFFLRLMN